LVEDIVRHVWDLKTGTYEGVGEGTPPPFDGVGEKRGERERVFEAGFALATPLAESCLDQINQWLLQGTGTVSTRGPQSDGRGGLIGTWELTWPALEATVDRFTGSSMPPVRVAVVFPRTLFHAHLALLRVQPVERSEGFVVEAGPDVICAWPFQVTSGSDVAHLEPLIWSIALGEIHERTARGKSGASVLILDQPQPVSWGNGA
jgi:hypothetical protein